jgi:hypothetical protein
LASGSLSLPDCVFSFYLSIEFGEAGIARFAIVVAADWLGAQHSTSNLCRPWLALKIFLMR